MSGLKKPPFEGTKIDFENILRWEDDGGQLFIACNPIDLSFIEMAWEPAARMTNVRRTETAG